MHHRLSVRREARRSLLGPALKCAGDILLDFNGKPVKQLQDLLKETRQVVAGTAASVTVLRYQQESTVMILLKP
jgi:S1-C subfamily serine protease